jgi:phage-related minor tail protein
VASASKSIEDSMSGSFNAVARTIADAAVSGQTSMSKLVDSILDDFDRVAIKDTIVKPIEGLVTSAVSSLFSSVSGALATGGPVAPGASYLVGEAGPELFTPSGNGTIVPNASLPGARAGAQIVVNIQAQDASSVLKSQSQITALIARAVAKGQKNL